ncbi:MAG: hypothetical protein HRU13_05800 [Phycisphaerales bacterium]|nr:hypothetical protein [Phycisphaerales bacterium]
MASATTTDIATTDLPTLLSELRQTRARAESLLAEIRSAQRESEMQTKGQGSSPAVGAAGEIFKRIAGTSSLDRAARDAERIIAAVDRRLSEIGATSHVSTSMADWVRGR